MTTEASPRILFATIAAGGSHVSTAQAMAEAVVRHGAEARVYEPMMEYGFAELDRRHKASWRRMLSNPASIVWGQRVIDAVPRVTVQLQRWPSGQSSPTGIERRALADVVQRGGRRIDGIFLSTDMVAGNFDDVPLGSFVHNGVLGVGM